MLSLADDPDRLPTLCETCKYLTEEIADTLATHNSFEILETGYNIDERLNSKSKGKKYMDSEVRFIEVMESVCGNILRYNVHAERSGSLRYAKGESQTMGTLKGLRNRGVKVELGIPEDHWDDASAEITQLKKYCDHMTELYEEEIEDWYFHHKDVTLTSFLCEKIILKSDEDRACLAEVFTAETVTESMPVAADADRERLTTPAPNSEL